MIAQTGMILPSATS